MKKIIEFKTVSDDNVKGLSVRVNYLLAQGWELSGGMVSAGTGGSLLSSGTITYSQAMVLYEGDYKRLSADEDLKFTQEISKYDGCMVTIIAGLTMLGYFIF